MVESESGILRMTILRNSLRSVEESSLKIASMGTSMISMPITGSETMDSLPTAALLRLSTRASVQ